MTKNTTRQLFAVLVALLLVCSFAGGPAVAAAAATGTFGEDVNGTLGADDGSTDDGSSGDDSTDDSTDDSSSDDDSTDDSSDDSGDGVTTDDSSDDSSDDASEDSSDDDSGSADDDSSSENITDTVDRTVNGTGSAVDASSEGVQNTVSATATTGVTLVGTVSETVGLQAALGLPSTGLTETERASSSTDVAAERYGPAQTATDEAVDGDGVGAADVSVPLVGTLGPDAALSGDSDGGEPLPAGLSGGATLGLGALAAVAVARSTPLFAGSKASATGSTASGYLSTLLDKVKPVVFPLRYSRYDDSDPLEHEAREMVYEIVNDTPGSYLSEVSERADLPLSTTRHHMKVLEREELVSGAKLRGKRRFYPAYAEGIELAAALNDDSTASIIDALSRLGAASVSDLADDLGRDPSTISHHLQRLEEDEIIVRERQGRAVMNKLSGEARTALEPETTPRPGEAVEALAD